MTARKPPPKLPVVLVTDPGEFSAAALSVVRKFSTLWRPDAAVPLDLETRGESYEVLAYEAMEERARCGLLAFKRGDDAGPPSPARGYASKSKVQSEIAAIQTAAKALADTLASIRVGAVDALNAQEAPNLYKLNRTVRLLEECAKNASPADDVRDGRGRKISLTTPQKIANLAAIDYAQITGDEPSRSKNKNKFLDFLNDLFMALRIEVKPDTVAQAAINHYRTWKRKSEQIGSFSSSF